MDLDHPVSRGFTHGGLLLEVKLCVVLCAVCCMSLCGCCVLCAVCCLLCVGCGALLPVLGLVPLPVLRLVPCCKPLKLCTCRFKVKCVCLLWVELWSLLGAVCGLWCWFLITLRWQGGVLSKVLGLLWVAFWPPVLSPLVALKYQGDALSSPPLPSPPELKP